MLRFGIIACSKVARYRFMPALLQSESATLSFIASRSPNKAKEYAANFGCNNYGTYDEVLLNPNIDAVYISTPMNFKKDLALIAGKNNKHVIIEKPAFLNQQDAKEIINLFKNNNLHIQEGWMFRYHPQHKKFKDLVEQSKFGKKRYFFGQFTYPTPPDGDIRLDSNLNGGVLFDSIGYPLSAALMLIKENVISVFSDMALNSQFGVDDFVKFHIVFKNNIYADLIAGFGMQYKSTYSMLCEKGILTVERAFSVDENFHTSITINTNEGDKRIKIKPANQFKLMIDRFCKDILNNNIGYHSKSILEQQVIVDAALRSLKEKKQILL